MITLASLNVPGTDFVFSVDQSKNGGTFYFLSAADQNKRVWSIEEAVQLARPEVNLLQILHLVSRMTQEIAAQLTEGGAA